MSRLPSVAALPVLGVVLAFVAAFPAVARADDSHDSATVDDALLAPPTTVPVVKTHVRVHLASKAPVQLESRATEMDEWSTACDAPCDRNLPLSDQYRITYGTHADPGEPFRLEGAMGSHVTVEAKPASQAGRIAGTAIAVVGGGLGALSLTGLVGGGYAVLSSPSCGEGSHDWCGLGKGIGYAVMVVSGVGLLLSGGIFAGGMALRSSAAASHSQRPSALREPTWLPPHPVSSARTGFVIPLSFAF